MAGTHAHSRGWERPRADRALPPKRPAAASASAPAVALVALLAAALSACATAPPVSSPTVAADMVALVASAEPEAITERSAVPFLFDGEILNRPQDVHYLWSGLRDHGFRATTARVAEVFPVGDGSSRRFADTTEVQLFFRRYVGADGVLVTATGFPAPVLLLLAPNEQGHARILGIRVGER